MASSSLEQRRWLVVGIALQNVLTPCLRDKIQNEMTPFYQHMVRNFGLDRQTYAAHQKTIAPSTVKLNYVSINNNAALHRSPRRYDYCVKDEVSLAKLFMKPFMAHFNAFDTSFDTSAALAVLCEALPFTAVKPFAEDVRSKVRNEWAHCDFAAWTEAHYHNCLDLMKALVTNLNVMAVDEARIVGELELWKTQGVELCLGKPLDDTLLHVIRNELQTLSESLDDYGEKADAKMKKVCDALDLFKSEFDGAIVSLQENQSSLQTTCEGMKEEMKWKDKEQKDIMKRQEQVEKKQEEMDKRQEQVEKKQEEMDKRHEQVETACKALEEKSSVMQKDLDVLRTLRDDRSPSNDSNVVFDAPDQNKWFTGRAKELEILEECLSFETDKKLKISSICGLGGCGKTTLAAEFAWKRKPEYEGGVFWICMEDDDKFRNSMNDLALRLGLMEDSDTFDLTLSKVLTYISQQKKPCLMVTDNVDQLTLSDEMYKVLSGRWKRQATCHLLLTTRREPKEVCERIKLEPPCCVELSSFSQNEAKSFLVARIGVDNATEQDEMLDYLAGELGCLPLALEQAGAYINALQCPIKEYLEGFKSQRLKLLSQHPANPSWEYESRSRLDIQTTWLINFEYIKKEPQGELASRFVQAAAFLAPDDIPIDFIDCEVLSGELSQGESGKFGELVSRFVQAAALSEPDDIPIDFIDCEVLFAKLLQVEGGEFEELVPRFVQATALLGPDDIPTDFNDCEVPSAELSRGESGNFPLLKHQIVDLLTKFSLFRRKKGRWLCMHRLTQYVIRENLTSEETLASLKVAGRLYTEYLLQGKARATETELLAMWDVGSIRESKTITTAAVHGESLLKYIWWYARTDDAFRESALADKSFLKIVEEVFVNAGAVHAISFIVSASPFIAKFWRWLRDLYGDLSRIWSRLPYLLK